METHGASHENGSTEGLHVVLCSTKEASTQTCPVLGRQYNVGRVEPLR